MRGLVLVGLLSGCAHYPARDVVLEGAVVAALVVDGYQSATATAHCGEQNPVIGHCGEGMAPSVYFPTVIGAHVLLTVMQPRGWGRTLLQAFTLGVESHVILRNYAVQHP